MLVLLRYTYHEKYDDSIDAKLKNKFCERSKSFKNVISLKNVQISFEM